MSFLARSVFIKIFHTVKENDPGKDIKFLHVSLSPIIEMLILNKIICVLHTNIICSLHDNFTHIFLKLTNQLFI